MNEELIKAITGVLDDFYKECRGNTVNPYNMLSLKNIMINAIVGLRPIENKKENKEGDKDDAKK